MVRSTDITSVTEFRQGLREHLDRVKQTNRPLYITTNGETEGVLLSPERYDDMVEKLERAELTEQIRRGIEDVRAGRTMEYKEAFRQIAKDLGIPWDR
jgi:prevent-host-death family protein